MIKAYNEGIPYSMANQDFADRVNEIFNNNRQLQGYLSQHGMSGRIFY
jgi:hypothetical protein